MAKKKIEQVQEETLITVSIWSKIKQWWRELIREEWELTIFFPSETKFLKDGSRIESTTPKTYRAKSISKLTTTNIIFVDLLGVKHEIKVVNPVGYDVRKIY
tara:strand:- start:586 stop:891 length:306 start_codon:yes stop_codon:yes gene_type:complete